MIMIMIRDAYTQALGPNPAPKASSPALGPIFKLNMYCMTSVCVNENLKITIRTIIYLIRLFFQQGPALLDLEFIFLALKPRLSNRTWFKTDKGLMDRSKIQINHKWDSTCIRRLYSRWTFLRHCKHPPVTTPLGIENTAGKIPKL